MFSSDKHINSFVIFSLLMLLCFGFVIDGQESKNKEEIADFRFVFEDGSTIVAKPRQEYIEVLTELDTIKIPFKKLLLLELGPKLSDKESVEFSSILANLGSEDHTKREDASQKLLRLGPRFYHRLEINTKDMEVKRRLSEAIKLQHEEHGVSFLRKSKLDSFKTSNISGNGTLVTKSIKAESKYLGSFDIDTCMLLTAQAISDVSSKEFELAGTQEDWFDTGIVLSGTRLKLTATGTLDLYTKQPGNFTCDPDGYQKDTNSNPISRGGALLYKLGSNIQTNFIGCSGFISGKGNLFLRVQKNPWNSKTEGVYKIKISKAR